MDKNVRMVLTRFRAGSAIGLGVALMALSGPAMAEITVMISGGFSLAYQEVIPDFERETGIAVTTLSGASQGAGPKTISAQLERGVHADLVILSREGLDELVAAGRIIGGSDKELARVPLAAAVRQGSPKPDIGSVDALKRSLLAARAVSMPESTSGQFLKAVVFPRLGIADTVSVTVVPRGIDSTSMLAAGGSDLALGPVSELVNQPNVELVGPLPEEVQLVQVFTAAIVDTARHRDEAERLTAFLASDRTLAAIRKAGMGAGRRSPDALDADSAKAACLTSECALACVERPRRPPSMFQTDSTACWNAPSFEVPGLIGFRPLERRNRSLYLF
ncbi:substrate-binding domain-containing protein [Methylobacterium soli]|nr:substrate-binding domain-containing protein [Methylobacterium soli]